ncbi:formylmethanofuran dehydrogenase [Azospirillum sp. sgz301742]
MATPTMANQRDVVCPFCGLGCDDLTVRAEPNGLAVESTDCPIARAGFARTDPAEPPRVGGNAVALDAAVQAAAKALGASDAPLIAGLGADVDGVRAALALAERVGAVVDHVHSEGLYRNLAVLQRTGWIATTFAELRNRCDLLVVAGPDPAAFHPRLYERWVTPPPAFQEPATREVVFLCGEPLDSTRAALAGLPVTVLPGDGAPVGEVAAALSAALTDPSHAAPDIAALAERLGKARYAVVAWAAAGFDGPHADLTVERLVRLVQDVNRHTRCAGLPLTGHDNVVGANQVCTWQFGVPLRTSLAGGVPVHDPYRFAWERFIDTADVVLWISAFRAEVPAFPAGKPVIVLAPPGTTFTEEPALFIPVGTPGIDHPGHVFRGDTVVALRTGRLIDRGLPDVAHVLNAITAALEAAC